MSSRFTNEELEEISGDPKSSEVERVMADLLLAARGDLDDG